MKQAAQIEIGSHQTPKTEQQEWENLQEMDHYRVGCHQYQVQASY